MMRALLVALALIVPCAANAGVWTGESHGSFCVGSSCDNTAPGAPTTTAGRVLIVYSIISSGGTARTLATPGGWTRIDPTTLDANTNFNTRVFCKVAVGGDTMPTLDWSGSGHSIAQQALSFSGPTAPDCSTIVHVSGASATASGGWPSQSLTITHANTLVLSLGLKIQEASPVDFVSITCPSDVTTGQFANSTTNSAFFPQFGGCYRVETTATSVSSTNEFIPSAQGNAALVALALSLDEQDSGGAPTFSSGPTYATVSNTQISATFTASAASLSYFCGLWLKGATPPTAAEVAAGTNAHSAIATGSTTGSSESHNITSSDSPTNPSYDPYCVLYNGTTYSAVPTTSNKATLPPTGFQYIPLASVTDAGSEPKAFNDADLITLGYDTQTANFTVGSVLVDATSGAWGFIRIDTDFGSAGDLTIDKRSGTFADNDVLYDQSGGAALVSGSESAYISAAVNDTLVEPLNLSPSVAPLTVDTSGQLSYTANGRQSALNGLIFHDATQNYFSLGLDAYFNNTAPHCNTAPTVVFNHGATIDYDVSALCSDFDNDTMSYARITALPTGASLDPTTGHVTGTVTVDATTAATFVVSDPASDYTTRDITFIVRTTWPMPNCTGLTASVCANQVLSLTSSSVSLSFNSQCSATIATGGVISTSPVSGATIAPGDTVSITESVGNICSVKSPDCTSAPTTTSNCESLYLTAFSSQVSFAPSARCNNSVGTGYVISTSPKANTEMPLNPNVSIVSSLGRCSTSSKPMVNCISHTTAECLGLLETKFGASVTLNAISDSCPTGYATGEIFSQAPAPGKKTQTPAILNVTYCQ